MTQIEMVFFGTIAAIVLLSWLNVYLKRINLERRAKRRAQRYNEPALRQSHPEGYDRPNAAGLLVLGMMLMGAIFALILVRNKYIGKGPPGVDPNLLSTQEYILTATGDTLVVEDETYSPMDAERKTGQYEADYIPPPLPEQPALADEPQAGNLLTGYSIQVEAYSDWHRAEKRFYDLVDQLHAYPVFLVEKSSDVRLPYKVLVGRYPSDRAARDALPDLQRRFHRCFPVNLADVKLHGMAR